MTRKRSPLPEVGIPEEVAEEVTEPAITILNVENRELLALIGNLALTARQHISSLEKIYESVRTLDVLAGASCHHVLSEELKRHDEAVAQVRVELESYLARKI